MSYKNLLSQLVEKEVISDEIAKSINISETNKPFSIHWELRSLLYLGITFLSTGLGVLIYKNIDTIGHTILIFLIAIACILCFYYAFRHRKPFTWQALNDTNNLDDYALLGGCLLFLTLEGYLQYQYTFFGTRYGLAALLATGLFFFCAYRFDHRGVLSMAITAFASWVGISIIPLKIWQSFTFNTTELTLTALALGFFLIGIGSLSEQNDRKKHFAFSYFFMGGNLAFVAALSGLFWLDFKIFYGAIVALLTFLSIQYARQTHSYLFLLMGIIYGYIGFTYSFFKLIPDSFDAMFYMLYFMLSGLGIILFLINIKKLVGIKNEKSIQRNLDK